MTKTLRKGSTIGGVFEPARLRARQLTFAAVTFAVVGLATTLRPSAAAVQSSAAITEDFTEEQRGSAPTSFSTPSGWWSTGTDWVDTKPISGQVGALTKTDSVDVIESFTVDSNVGE